jgi:hypothetical protein
LSFSQTPVGPDFGFATPAELNVQLDFTHWSSVWIGTPAPTSARAFAMFFLSIVSGGFPTTAFTFRPLPSRIRMPIRNIASAPAPDGCAVATPW